MNQAICLVGAGNWTVHKVETFPPSSLSRDLKRERGGRGREGEGEGERYICKDNRRFVCLAMDL